MHGSSYHYGEARRSWHAQTVRAWPEPETFDKKDAAAHYDVTFNLPDTKTKKHIYTISYSIFRLRGWLKSNFI